MKCLHCGKKFKDRTYQGGSSKLYCSNECRLAHQREIRKAKGYKPPKNILNICEKCGKEFNSVKNKKYCSIDCYLSRNITTLPTGEKLLRCSICKQSKLLSSDFFHRTKNSAHGFLSHCKECASKKAKTPSARKSQAASRKKRADAIKEYETKRQSTKEYKVNRNIAEAIRKKTDPNFALKCRMRILVYQAIKRNKNNKKWQELVGYTIDDLKTHLEKQFTAGMTWEKFMSGDIHIDHIIPISAYSITSPDDSDFKKCWSLDNLQPLWAIDNIKKKDKLDYQIQPLLAMEA